MKGTQATQDAANPAALIAEFYSAPADAYFQRPVVAVVVKCSTAKLERDTWRGVGIPFRRRDDVAAGLLESQREPAAPGEQINAGKRWRRISGLCDLLRKDQPGWAPDVVADEHHAAASIA